MAAINNIENVTILGTSADVLNTLSVQLAGVSNIENLKVIVATDKQLRDAIARVIWPDKPARVKL